MIKRNKRKVPEKKSITKPGPVHPHQDVNITGEQWQENIKYVRRTFPGPSKTMVPLRVALNREAFVKITEHVMKSIDQEVCGVLVGEVCVDEEGFFVQVRNIIKGSAAQQGGAHVTFTHETWNQIHARLETDFPDFDILGWYHSHPGFGVSFSEMDLFIQRNFFPSPTQVALVMDPLGGEKALCVNTPQGVQYIDKFWVDGREYRAFKAEKQSTDHSQYPSKSKIEEWLPMIETRLNQVLQALDKLSLNIFRALTVMAALFCVLIIAVVFYSLFLNPTKSNQPPKVLQYVPVPVKIGENDALIGVAIIDWKIPPELSSYFDKVREESSKKTVMEQGSSRSWFKSNLQWIINHLRYKPTQERRVNETGPPAPGTRIDPGSNNNSHPKQREKNNDIDKQ